MATPNYQQGSIPSDNIKRLLDAQVTAGATAADPLGAEPYEVLSAKALFNANQIAEAGGGGGGSLPGGTGLVKVTAGVASVVDAPSGTVVGTSDAQTLTNKSIAASQLTGAIDAARLPALTGDVTSSAGSAVTTLPVVNANVGSFTNANITVNAKGQVTAAANGSGSSSTNISQAINETAHGFAVGDVVYNNNGDWTKAQADAALTSTPIGVVSVVADANNFTVVYSGTITLSGLTAGAVYYLSAATAGLLTDTAPTGVTEFLVPVIYAATTTQAYIIQNFPSSLAKITGSEVDLDTDVTLAADSDTVIPSQKAIKAYVDASSGGGGGGGYGISLMTGNSTPGDGNTIYFGQLTLSPGTVPTIRRVYVPVAGTITAAEIYSYANGIAGSSEDVSVYVRLNNTTDTLIQTVGASTAGRRFFNTGLSIAVAAGDYFEIKVVWPTQATDSTSVAWGGTIYIAT